VLADWAGTGAMEFVPVVRRMREILLRSARLFAHETTMPILDPGRDKTKKGYVWAIARDDRPWGGADPSAVVFEPRRVCRRLALPRLKYTVRRHRFNGFGRLWT
jgi:hypothetical protein